MKGIILIYLYLCSGNFDSLLASKPVIYFCAAWTFSAPRDIHKIILGQPEFSKIQYKKHSQDDEIKMTVLNGRRKSKGKPH